MPSNVSTPKIHGTTEVYFILGDPVEQVRAPETFNAIFARNGIDAVLVPVQIAAASLAAFVQSVFQARNVKGLWVTMPHKEAMVSLMDYCSETAAVAGAVNAVRRNANGQLEGALFDGEGFVSSLTYYGISHTGKRVLILGAGGAAAAIGAPLALHHGTGSAMEIALYDPAPGKAATLAARIAKATGTCVRAIADSDPAGYDLVINASPLGLNHSDALPCDVARISEHASVVDIIMKNQPTPLVRAVRGRSMQAQPGFEMLIQQAHCYLDFFGYSNLALQLKGNATPLREQMYPAELAHEIRHPYRPPQSLAA